MTAGPDWPFYRNDFTGDSFISVPLTTSQADAFQLAWTYPGTGGIEDSNGVVVGGLLYQAYYSNKLRAIDVATGTLRWTASMGAPLHTPCAPNFNNGAVGAPAVEGGRVFVPGGDGKLYAFDATTGAQLWSTQIADNTQNEFLWASAFPLKGRIYVGVATFGGEEACGPAPGRLVAVTQTTGAVYGTWWADTLHRGGGTIWTQPTYDAVSGRLFVNTANIGLGLTAAQEPFGQAVVAIDPDTMQAVDSYQVVATDSSTDYDFGASPALVDTPLGKHLIIAVNKNGFVYALDRNNLASGIVWSHQISGPGTSPEMGEGTLVSPAVANGRVFVGGGATPDGFSGAVAALNADTGQQLWVFHPDGFVLAALTAVGDVVVAPTTGGSKGHVYVLGQTDGAVHYRLDSSAAFISQTTFAEGLLFAGDETGNIYALRPGAGSGPTPIGPVTGLTATGGTGQVALSWTNPTGAYASTRIIQSLTGFASSPTPSGDQTIVFDAAGTSTTVTGLAASTKYFYTAWARDTSGNWSTSAATASATTAGSGGGGSAVSFSDSFASCTSTTDLGLNWSIVNGRWYCAGSKGRGESAASLALAKTATMTDTDVTVRVQFASSTLGSGGLSARVGAGSYYAARALTSGRVQLIRVIGTSVTILGDVAQTVTAEPSSHRLRLRATGAGPVQLDVWFDNVNLISMQDTSAQRLTIGQAGLYNGNDSRSMFDSFSLTATTSTTPTPIGPVTGLTATGGTGQVALSWTNPTGAYASTRIIQSLTGFASSPTPSGDQTIVFDASGTSTTATGLAASTKYFYTAWARDTSGNWSTSSATASATTASGSTPLGPVSNFVATGGTSQVALSWTNPTGAYASTRVIQSLTGFASSPTPSGDQTIVFDTAGTSTTVTGLAASTKYFYTAWARDTSGNWSTSAATASATTASSGTPVSFADSFSSCTSTTDLGPNWTIVNGRWYCAGSKGRGETASSQALAKTAAMAGTDVTVRVQFADPSQGSGGVVARSGTGGYYAARALTSGHFQIIRVNGSTVTVLGDFARSISSEPSSYRIRLRVSGTSPVQLDAWFEGTQVLSLQDASSQALASGQAGLYNGTNTRGMYASFSVSSF